MAYNYSNPYAPQPMEVINKSQPSTPTSYTVLFGGLPKDVRELQLKELFAVPSPAGLSLHPSASTITFIFDPNGQSLGMALITVSSETIAEEIRAKFSGQTIDDVNLTVQHILPVDFSLPLPTPGPPTTITRLVHARPNQLTPPTTMTPTQPRGMPSGAKQGGGRVGGQHPLLQKGSGSANHSNNNSTIVNPNGKPPGLALLSRLGKPGAGKVATPSLNTKGMTPREKQLALMAAQRSAKAPGQSLLQRLAKPSRALPPSKTNPTSSTTNTSTARKVSKSSAAVRGPAKADTSGTAKVGRAKEKAAKNMKMDIDQDAGGGSGHAQGKKGKEVKVQKTQQELDEEMRAYERARRFGASA